MRARHALPLRPALKSLSGSGRLAPWEKVSFTFSLIFVGVADRDHSVMRPHRTSHPLPLLDYLPVGLRDALADAGERFATPVCEFCDQLVD
jgi:hypothetical protein